VASHAPKLTLSQNLLRLRPPAATFCSSRACVGGSRQRSAADVLREAEKLVKPGVRELIVIAHDTAPMVMVSTSDSTPSSPWRDRQGVRRAFSTHPRLGSLGAWGRLQYFLPLPAFRRGHAADDGAMSADTRCAFPACFACGLEGDAPAGGPGKDAGAHPRLARDLPGLDHTLDFSSRLSRRDEEVNFRFLVRDWRDEANLYRVVCVPTSRS